jgi:hypothetical protein
MSELTNKTDISEVADLFCGIEHNLFALAAKVEELEKDKARLDKLQSQWRDVGFCSVDTGGNITIPGFLIQNPATFGKNDLRIAIDTSFPHLHDPPEPDPTAGR